MFKSFGFIASRKNVFSNLFALALDKKKISVTFKGKMGDEKKLVQSGKFETLTICRQAPSTMVVVLQKNHFFIESILPWP